MGNFIYKFVSCLLFEAICFIYEIYYLAKVSVILIVREIVKAMMH
jgi:hypothetical protein